MLTHIGNGDDSRFPVMIHDYPTTSIIIYHPMILQYVSDNNRIHQWLHLPH